MTKRMFRVPIIAIATLLLVVLLTQFSASKASFAAPETDGIAVNPATNGAPDVNRSRFDYKLNSGQPARDSIYVYNAGSTIQDVTIYARDAFTGTKGEFLIQEESSQPIDVGSWVEFDGNKTSYMVTLKPRAFVTIPFTVNTPSNASPGDHVGAIVASATTSGENLNIVRRVAVRLYARLSGQISPRLEVTHLKAVPSQSWWNPFSSSLSVSYDLQNTGNVELSADVVVQPLGGFDWATGSAVQSRITNLLPGSKRHVNLSVKDLVLSSSSGIKLTYVGVFPANYESAQQPKGQQVVSEATFPVAWLVWTAALLLIAGVFIFAVRRIRRISSKDDDVSLV
jgi:dihydroorotate dehydrogenase (fumarate)